MKMMLLEILHVNHLNQRSQDIKTRIKKGDRRRIHLRTSQKKTITQYMIRELSLQVN
jgi:hypothetical protein